MGGSKVTGFWQTSGMAQTEAQDIRKSPDRNKIACSGWVIQEHFNKETFTKVWAGPWKTIECRRQGPPTGAALTRPGLGGAKPASSGWKLERGCCVKRPGQELGPS